MTSLFGFSVDLSSHSVYLRMNESDINKRASALYRVTDLHFNIIIKIRPYESLTLMKASGGFEWMLMANHR